MTKCDMTKDCLNPISHIDRKAYVSTRKLKPKELKQITDNKLLEKY